MPLIERIQCCDVVKYAFVVVVAIIGEAIVAIIFVAIAAMIGVAIAAVVGLTVSVAVIVVGVIGAAVVVVVVVVVVVAAVAVVAIVTDVGKTVFAIPDFFRETDVRWIRTSGLRVSPIFRPRGPIFFACLSIYSEVMLVLVSAG